MRPWIKRALIGLFGASILLGGLTACGHQRYGDWSSMSEADATKMRERMVERVSSKLDLDATQKQRLTALADKLKEQRVALAGGANPRADIEALIAGPKFERERAQGLVEAKTAALRSKSPEVIAAMADFYDGLRPEQQQKVRAFLAKRGHGWRS